MSKDFSSSPVTPLLPHLLLPSCPFRVLLTEHVPFHFSCLRTFLFSGFSKALHSAPSTPHPHPNLPVCDTGQRSKQVFAALLKVSEYPCSSVSHGSGQKRAIDGSEEEAGFHRGFRESPARWRWSARAWIPTAYLGSCVLSTARTPCLRKPHPTSVTAQLLLVAPRGAQRQRDSGSLQPLSRGYPSLLMKCPCVSPFIYFFDFLISVQGLFF